MSAPIVITVPTKYVPINLAPAGITIKTESLPDEGEDSSSSSMEEFLVRGKKRRLDHLTWEEKLQRKKLKNRVAAQTSRDRKKAKMEDMEKTIQEQSDQISELQSKCDSLAQEKDAIYGKYLDLEGRFEELKRRLDEQQQQQQQQQQISTPTAIKSEPSPDLASGSVGCVSTLLGSAASAQTPLPQGLLSMEAQTTLRQCQQKTTDEKVAALWKIIALCLLYRTCSKTSMCPSSKSSPKASWPTSQASWKSLIDEAARLMPKMQAPASECLDQCIILTTHNYSKSPFHVERTHLSLQAESTVLQQSVVNPDTVYGTYDNENNCITIILDNDDGGDDARTGKTLEEEIICEESDEEMLVQEPEFQIKIEPMQQLLSPIPSIVSTSSYSSVKNEEALDTMKNPPTPRSLISDGGYESIGSPDYSMGTLDEFWNLDLFPILN
ncbi:hypothetical protein pipiens_007079 [Culex pipiens pipiens]|uniref:X-box-binding protein 1 n=1 Tax=Culex pipiens pipiens TaxID=38569 RepID=A0ABD1DMV1_CULPP